MKRTEQLLKQGAFSHIKKHGFRKFLKDWKYNFIMLQTPEHLLNQEIYGLFGTIIGLTIIFIAIAYTKRYYILLAIAFSALMIYSQLKQKMQQKQTLVDLKEGWK